MKRKNALLTPLALSDTEKVGRRQFWKQILPVTDINYDGKKISFDRQFHMDLAQGFQKQAFDQVPVVFAGDRNDHNMDPRNFGGEVVRTEYRGEGKEGGTWALIEADKSAAKAIEKNPKLGVSARIRQGIEKADGRFFKRGIEHVLLTMNPRVTGMSPWQAVDLSEVADVEVVDLTAQDYTEGKTMAKTKSRADRRQIDLSELSDEEFQRLLDLAATATVEDDTDEADAKYVDEEGNPVDKDGNPLDDGDATEPTVVKRKSRVKVTKITERDSENTPDGTEGEDEGDEDGDTDLSDVVQFRNEFRADRAERAAKDWKSKRGMYLAQGVPPVLLDLAEPVLSQPDHMTLDLADGEKEFDVHEFASSMLDQVTHIIDMSGPIGSSVDLSVDDDTKSEADALLDAWDQQYG